jgi:hypothetical protein
VKIEIGGIEALSKEYRHFDEFIDELVDHENAHGRRVPDYDIGILLSIIVVYLFTKAIDKITDRVFDAAIDQALERTRRRKADQATDASDSLEAQRDSELEGSIVELQQAVQHAVETRPPNSALTEDAASLSALLRWARDNNVKITVTLETEAEGELREAFEAATKDVPGSAVNDSRGQIE